MQPPHGPSESHHRCVESRPPASDVAFVRLLGEADLHAASALRDALDRAISSGAGLIVIDLTDVTFIDSMMLGVLLGVTRQTRARGISTRVVADDPHVRRMFELTLLDRVLAVHPTVELAVADRGVRV